MKILFATANVRGGVTKILENGKLSYTGWVSAIRYPMLFSEYDEVIEHRPYFFAPEIMSVCVFLKLKRHIDVYCAATDGRDTVLYKHGVAYGNPTIHMPCDPDIYAYRAWKLRLYEIIEAA